MIINDITMRNYRCFSNVQVFFTYPLTVLAGVNGSGKSTILDALAIAIGTFLSGFDGMSNSGISKEDVLYKCYDMGSVIDLQPQYPASILAHGFIDKTMLEWERTLQGPTGRTTIVGAKQLIDVAESYQRRIREGDVTAILPIISYYGTGRLWAQKKEKRENDELQKFSREKGYMDCLASESNEKMMLKWFQKMTIQEATKGTTSPELSAVKRAIAACFESITGFDKVEIQFNLDTHAIDILYMTEDGNHRRSPINDLSDGYKNTLSMVADIAYRMALLNPQLFDNVLNDTPGVVLIDEIDLHLHPTWQKRILNDLTTIFPKVQFIVSTHAPAVLNSIKNGAILVIKDNKAFSLPKSMYGRDANSIMREVMETSERPEEVKILFEKFYNEMSDKNLDEAKTTLDTITKLVGESDPEIVSCIVSLELEQL